MDAVMMVAQTQWLENYDLPAGSGLTWNQVPEDVQGLFLASAAEVVAAISSAHASSSEDALELAARSLASARPFGAPWDLLGDASKAVLRGRVSCGMRALGATEVRTVNLPAA